MPAALMLIALFVMRPTWFGQLHSLDGTVLIVAGALLALAADARRSRSLTRPARDALIWISVFSGWYLVIPLIGFEAPPGLLIKSAVEVVLTVLAAGLITRKVQRAVTVARVFILISAAMCAFYVVSLALWLTSGTLSHILYSVPIPKYGATAQPVYFPFTPTSGVYEVTSNFSLPRFLGYMREPGLLQAALMWCLFSTLKVDVPARRTVRMLLVVGILGTLSTAGFGILLFTLIVTGAFYAPHRASTGALAAWRVYVNVLVGCAAVWLAFYAPLLGLTAKQDINQGSIDDRQSNALHGLQQMVMHPLGASHFDTNGAINLLAEAGVLGVVGFALGLLAFFRPIFLASDRTFAARCVLPIALTALVAQPLTGAPMTWALIVLTYGLDRAAAPRRERLSTRAAHASMSA